MKSLIAAVVVALSLAAGSVWHHGYVKKTTDKIFYNTEKIASSVNEKDYKAANDYVITLHELIVREEALMGVICDHKEYYDIKRAVGELTAFINQEDEGESLAHCAAIISLTERISEISKPYISNIL